MKNLILTSVVLTVALPAGFAVAQQGMDCAKGMDCTTKGAGMNMAKNPGTSTPTTHTVKGVVKKIDTKASTVTLAHEPVNSLNWPAMTMGFKVADKMLLDKLAEGKKVEVELKQVGRDYVINAIK